MGDLCNGICTRGPWSPDEQALHINCLELLAATLTLYQRLIWHNSSENGQYHSCGIYQQVRGDSTTNAIANDKGPVPMVHGEKYLNSCSALTRSSEYHCWQGVEDLVRQIRMEAITSNLPQNQPRAGASFNGSVCKQDTSSTDNICQLEARSFSYSHRCLHTGLVHNAGQVICQPTLDMIGRVLSQVCQQSVQELILVAPVWRAQVWNPTLLQIRSEVIMLE